MDDFLKGVKDIKSIFGDVSDQISKYCDKPLVIWSHFKLASMDLLDKVESLSEGHIMRILVHDKSYTGKTTLACQVVQQLHPSCARMINSMLLSTVTNPCHTIHKTFDEITKVSDGVIILDALERLIEWCPLGVRINNQILQSLLVEMTQHIIPTQKTLVIMTCDNKTLIDELGMTDLFDYVYELPNQIEVEDAKLFGLPSATKTSHALKNMGER
jgi:SpoVK/Ycf46/Vps4 family AAA+-type ATPase